MSVWLEVQTVLVAFILSFGAYLILRRLWAKPYRLPPGPPSLPFIGNLFMYTSSRPLHVLRDLGTKYGEVFTIRLGSKVVLVLNSLEAARHALVHNGDNFIGRPILPGTDGKMNEGMVFSSGSEWKSKRRLLLSSLRTFGMGKSLMERRVTDERAHLLQEFDAYNGGPFDPTQTVTNAVSNITCSFVVGHRFEYSDSRFTGCLSAVDSLFRMAQTFIGFAFLWPGASQLCDLVLKRASRAYNQAVYDTFEPFIEEHDASYDPGNMRDLLDVFLAVTKEWESQAPGAATPADDNVNTELYPFKYYRVYRLLLDMFAAGTETTATTLMWAWLYLMKYPDVQTRAQEEIDRVVGTDRPPEMSDRANLPYVEATVTEILRLTSTVPLSVPRWTTNDTKLYGYDVPKDTMVWLNIWSIHRDPSIWKNPETFDPCRFLDSEGNFSRSSSLITFGLGSRSCIGEQLSKMELFLLISSVLQRYTLQSADEFPLPDLDGDLQLTLKPKQYMMRAVERQRK